MSRAAMSIVPKFPCAKMSPCQKVPVSKSLFHNAAHTTPPIFLWLKMNFHQSYMYLKLYHRDIHICRMLQKIQVTLILLCVLAEPAVLGSAKTALKFKYEI